MLLVSRSYSKKRSTLEEPEDPRDRQRFRQNYTDYGDMASGLKVGSVVVFVFGLTFTIVPCVQVVDANTVGIPVSYGSIQQPVSSGFHLMAPWVDVHTFSLRMQETSMLRAIDEGDKEKDDSIEVRGSDGYLMNVDVTVRYFIVGDSANRLFTLVGSEDGVRERLVRPEVRESVRSWFAKYTSEEGYTSEREAIRQNISVDLAERLAKYNLRLDSIAIRNVAPDTTLAKAISDRAAAREKALQATIEQERLTTEAETRRKVAETDAKAKVIAAQAESDANEIITKSITPDLLTLKQIEALRDANTVYIEPGASVIVGQQQQK
jgi:regulator of protease activity HflC (stomatin/prohibitin superfamily)